MGFGQVTLEERVGKQNRDHELGRGCTVRA
jgi:hypothetical protein